MRPLWLALALSLLAGSAFATPQNTRFAGAAAFPMQTLPSAAQLPQVLYKATKVRAREVCQTSCDLLRTAASASYTDSQGRNHFMAAIVGEMSDAMMQREGDHAAAALIGMVDLVQTTKGWVIDNSAPFATASGNWGKAPDIRIIDAGKWGKAIVLMPGHTGQGVTEQYWEMWLPRDGAFWKAAELQTVLDSSGACDGSDKSCGKNDFKTKIDVLLSNTGDGSLYLVATTNKGVRKTMHLQ